MGYFDTLPWWSGPTLYGIFPYSGLKFYFYEDMKTHVPEEHKNDIIVKLACGSIAGLLGQTMTYPLDVVRRQMQVHYFWCEVLGKWSKWMKSKHFFFQVQAFSSLNKGVAKGTFETLVTITQSQGWRQLFSGLSLNYLKVSKIIFFFFQYTRDWHIYIDQLMVCFKL